ncbi:hypothetical protein I203_101038 [Kwoniella mangroviensis CBS 8507]|uniref:uncharacterized protein n=1 Tax=Kwoniella mangroviensis CBS 8507 TaxID=1296122 RepID=UPI00080D5583|nr:uncharacterized protein I203_02675 [Kwoniella mangroviensis CBS 8507]OCF68016.1 hypothetical protein I203_02675 [Kwoniella mangroviensis CBS 8507]
MPDARSSNSEPGVDPSHNDPEADFMLVSSDNVAFKIYKFYLLAHSTIFRDMISSCSAPAETTDRLDFTDSQIGHSSTITIFLNTICGRPLKLVRDSLGPFRDCIQFCKKYECEILWTALRAHAAAFLDQHISPHYIFIIVAELDDVDLASRAISTVGSWQWPIDEVIPDLPRWMTSGEVEESKTATSLGLSKGAGVLEITSWPIWEFHRVPLPYVIGLIKVGRKFSLAANSGNDIPAGKYFKEIMEEWQKGR